MTTQEILEAARGAKTAVALSDSGTRDSALLGMADALCAPESMDAILAASGPYVFLLDTVRSPDRLDLTIDDASWSGTRIASPAPK